MCVCVSRICWYRFIIGERHVCSTHEGRMICYKVVLLRVCCFVVYMFLNDLSMFDTMHLSCQLFEREFCFVPLYHLYLYIFPCLIYICWYRFIIGEGHVCSTHEGGLIYCKVVLLRVCCFVVYMYSNNLSMFCTMYLPRRPVYLVLMH